MFTIEELFSMNSKQIAQRALEYYELRKLIDDAKVRAQQSNSEQMSFSI